MQWETVIGLEVHTQSFVKPLSTETQRYVPQERYPLGHREPLCFSLCLCASVVKGP